MSKKEWFAAWFDTSYYHMLYKNRNDEEAFNFIQNLAGNLNLEKGSRVMDLACGKGRHSVTLNKLGFDVLGVDLSANSIEQAKAFENDTLHFGVCDMRDAQTSNEFDCIFNLFTSFGYFDSQKDNAKVINAMHRMLKNDGLLVIDFMNAKRIIDSLVLEESKEVEGVVFNITRHYDGEHIFKNIKFEDKGEQFDFTERVQALQIEDFETLLKANGFNILSTFGNFDLKEFEKSTSDRLIVIAQKK